MSHYTVAVIHHPEQDIDELLAPFDENIKVPKYISYTKQQAVAHVRKYWKDVEDLSDEECYVKMAADYEDDMKDAEGNLYSTYNPQSKWDWYQEGGRWSGLLKDKRTGEECDEGRIGDLDFCIDEDEYKRAIRFWEVAIDHKPANDDEEFHTFFKEEYYRERYGTKENYARRCASFTTYAVLTPDGVWHAPGEMGWFGCSSESDDESRDWDDHYIERFIESADPNDILTIVDCHI